VVRRHEGLRRFFVDILRIDDEEADRVACDMEHSIPQQVMDRLLIFIDFIADSPHGGLTWSPESGFGLRSTDGTQPDDGTD
jgi:DtxR family Mn-dependent transcriptional regulator